MKKVLSAKCVESVKKDLLTAMSKATARINDGRPVEELSELRAAANDLYRATKALEKMQRIGVLPGEDDE